MILRVILILAVVFMAAVPVSAQEGESPVTLAVIDENESLITVSELGCAYSDGMGYPFEVYFSSVCYNCSTLICTFESVRPGLGGYVQTALLDDIILSEDGAWQTIQGSQTAVLWGDAPWGEMRYITFVLAVAPTPIPTLTPIPTVEPPSAVTFSEGFGAGFDESFGQLSSYGIIPDFGLDHTQWLFAARKWIQAINQGNLLYVMGGILMAVLVLKWAIDRLKNPR